MMQYIYDVYLLLHGELTDWERDFLKSIRKRLPNNLTEKQEYWIKKIRNKYLKKSQSEISQS